MRLLATSWALGFRPTEGDKKRPLASNLPPWKRHPPLCHLDRSVPRFPASRHLQQPRMRLSVEKGARSLPAPPSSTGNLGERSGEISVLTTSPGNVFGESVAKWRELLFLFRLSRAL